jgi:hypothetical protein
MRPCSSLCCLLVVCWLGSACGGAGGEDASGVGGSGAEVSAAPDTAGQDLSSPEDTAAVSDAGAGEVVGVDLGGAESDGQSNTPPSFSAPPAMTLKMGYQDELDLGPFLSDTEDGAAGLVLSWTSQHVALEDQGAHRLRVVAPTNWFGVEQIALTATDGGGLTAIATLAVTVEEVTPPDPVTPSCDAVTFSYHGGEGVQQVLLAGEFNGWADTPETADVMLDEDGDQIWEFTRVLEPGSYQYKFIVDGIWTVDQHNPKTTDDGHGGLNSVIDVDDCDAQGRER